jgi:hypothetical protein
MNARIRLTRAIGNEFLVRKLKSIVLLYAAISIVVVGIAIWLTTVSIWWWFLAAPVLGAALLGVIVLVVASWLLRLVAPQLTVKQNEAVIGFVDKLERVAENLQTPMFIIVFRVVRDVVRPREQTFIQTVAQDSTTLHTDFAKLQKLFTD